MVDKIDAFSKCIVLFDIKKWDDISVIQGHPVNTLLYVEDNKEAGKSCVPSYQKVLLYMV